MTEPETQMPWENAAAFLASVVAGGGSGGKLLDLRPRDDGSWDVVLLLDGGYSDREDAEGALRIAAGELQRAYIAELDAGRIDAAPEHALAKLGIRRTTPKT